EIEAQAAPGGVAGVEGERADDEPGGRDREGEEEGELEQRRDRAGEGEDQERGDDDEIADEDALRVGEILETVSEHAGVRAEIAAFPDLRPGGVEAERGDREEDVDDPDPEIFLPDAG